MTPDWRIDETVTSDTTMYHSEILTRYAARLQLTDQIRVRSERLRHNEHPACFLIKPMYDTGARQVRDLRCMFEQRVEERPLPISASGMHDESSGLVDDEQRFVLENHIQGYLLWPVRKLLRIYARNDMDGFSALNLLAWQSGPPV
jgi:hypothetical protein